MATHKFFTAALFSLFSLGMVFNAAAQSDEPDITMDQAVLKVQQETGGKVLSAEPHHVGRRMEYRIKVLTPQGHVRVMAIPSEANRGSMTTRPMTARPMITRPMTTPIFTPPIKNPPGRKPGSKEKH